MNSVLIFEQMIVLLTMMFLGYASYRKGVINDDMSKRLSTLLVNIFNPILVVGSVLGGMSDDFVEMNCFLHLFTGPSFCPHPPTCIFTIQ